MEMYTCKELIGMYMDIIMQNNAPRFSGLSGGNPVRSSEFHTQGKVTC